MKSSFLLSKKLNCVVFLLALLSGYTAFAQTETNFSGKWEFDKSMSILNKSDIDYDGTTIMEIVQDKKTFKYKYVFIKPGNSDFATEYEVFVTDAKEKIEKSSMYVTTKKAYWSDDKKVLNLYVLDVNESKKEYLVIEKISLSEDGKTLTVEKYSKNDVVGEQISKFVYHKK